jgi:hypothetical protein
LMINQYEAQTLATYRCDQCTDLHRNMQQGAVCIDD